MPDSVQLRQPEDKQHDLDVRVTGLERDMHNMSKAIVNLSHTVDRGFAETRKMLTEAESRNSEHLTRVHTRLEESALERVRARQWNPGLVLAAITCAILVGGVFVSFVHMTYGSAARDIQENRDAMQMQKADNRHEFNTLHTEQYRTLERQFDFEKRISQLETKHEAPHAVSSD